MRRLIELHSPGRKQPIKIVCCYSENGRGYLEQEVKRRRFRFVFLWAGSRAGGSSMCRAGNSGCSRSRGGGGKMKGLKRRANGPYAHAECVRDTSDVEVNETVHAEVGCNDGCHDLSADAAAAGGRRLTCRSCGAARGGAGAGGGGGWGRV